MKRRASCGLPQRKLIWLAVAAALSVSEAYANPTGAVVVGGQASFNAIGNTLSVTNSPGAIINWRGFSIGASETTRFLQQSAASSVLNRVLGTDPSTILGTLSSNGKVFLVNPAGILVGQGARIDVGGLVATTLNLSNTDFLSGKHNYQPVANAGNIVNNLIENTWLPPSVTTPWQTAWRSVLGLLGRLAGNAWEEYWPDVVRLLKKK